MNNKKKKRKLLTVIALCMACVTLFGAMAALLPGSSRDLNQDIILGSSPNEVVLPDVLSRAEMLTAVSSKAHVVPANATEYNFVSFSEVLSSDKEVISNIPGYAYRNYINYGSISTLDHYLEFTTEEDAQNAKESCAISFDFGKGYSSVNITNMDYITVDFDIWTNTRFANELVFYFTDSLKNIDDNPRLSIKYYEDTGETYIGENTSGRYSGMQFISDPTKPMHLTFVCKLDNGSSTTYVYLDGKYLCSANNFTHTDLRYFDMYLRPVEERSNQGVSICVDNFQINTFGRYGKPYTGALDDLYESTSKTLFDCEDSVLYNK